MINQMCYIRMPPTIYKCMSYIGNASRDFKCVSTTNAQNEWLSLTYISHKVNDNDK